MELEAFAASDDRQKGQQEIINSAANQASVNSTEQAKEIKAAQAQANSQKHARENEQLLKSLQEVQLIAQQAQEAAKKAQDQVEVLELKLNQSQERSQRSAQDGNQKIAEVADKLKQIDEGVKKVAEAFDGLTISGQITAIYQTSSVKMRQGDLRDSSGADLTGSDLTDHSHKTGASTLSANIGIDKKLDENERLHFDLQFANGLGVDGNLQGGAMVNNDVMQDANNPDEVYLAKAFYEGVVKLPSEFALTVNVGKFGVNDYFDVGAENSDQTKQFLNQAVANNGAFDYVQDLQGHGYTYGTRFGLANELIGFDFAYFSSDNTLDNIRDKYSLVGGITLTPTWGEDLKGVYQFYTFSNRGEYAAFDGEGNLVTKDVAAINTKDNADTLTKSGFGFSLTQALSDKINVFGKYGKQDDDRDVRHYQDMDESIMFGGNISGKFWKRENDKVGIAYEIGKLTGNHKKAHEKGYESFFDRSGGIGAGNYADERVFEIYYNYGITEHTNVSLDFQHISNFYYSKVIGAQRFAAVRLNSSF